MDESKETPITIKLNKAKHTAFKARCVQDDISMTDVIKAAIDDYTACKWRPRPRDRKSSDRTKGA